MEVDERAGGGHAQAQQTAPRKALVIAQKQSNERLNLNLLAILAKTLASRNLSSQGGTLCPLLWEDWQKDLGVLSAQAQRLGLSEVMPGDSLPAWGGSLANASGADTSQNSRAGRAKAPDKCPALQNRRRSIRSDQATAQLNDAPSWHRNSKKSTRCTVTLSQPNFMEPQPFGFAVHVLMANLTRAREVLGSQAH